MFKDKHRLDGILATHLNGYCSKMLKYVKNKCLVLYQTWFERKMFTLIIAMVWLRYSINHNKNEYKAYLHTDLQKSQVCINIETCLSTLRMSLHSNSYVQYKVSLKFKMFVLIIKKMKRIWTRNNSSISFHLKNVKKQFYFMTKYTFLNWFNYL